MGKKVFLKEAVKPTESEGTATSQAEKDPKWMQAKAAWEKLTSKKFDEMPTAQKISISRNVLKPAASKGYLENPRTKERTPISNNTATAQQPVQQAPTQQPVQQAPTQQPVVQPTVQQPVQQTTQTSNQNVDDGETEEIQTIQQSNTQVQPLVTSDDGEGYTADEIEKMINSVTTTALASPDQDEEENFKNKSTVSEKRNIAKFLKFLSEKNYAVANKYLKNIVENKIKRKISGAIK